MRFRSIALREYLIENLQEHENDIIAFTAKMFSISVQSVHRHLKKLIEEGIIEASGNTKARKYSFKQTRYVHKYEISDTLKEDIVWKQDINQYFKKLPANVIAIWNHCFSEIFNNAREHSDAKSISVVVYQDYLNTMLQISDNGIGLFNKVRNFMQLQDNRDVAIELAKGKMTTSKENHSGEGIFFTSRMVDRFLVLSYGISWIHDFNKTDWIFEENQETEYNGTRVIMVMSNKVDRTVSEIFDKYGKQAFDTTIIPIILMTTNGEGIVSRSQARRLLARLESFDNIGLDFKGVKSIGQAFADEIFRVFANSHPDAKIIPINMNKEVENMIIRVQNTKL